MKSLRITILFILFLTNSIIQAQEFDKRTPFSAIDYIDNQPYFQYDNQWVKIVSIEGIPIQIYLENAMKDDPTDWKRGFHRYLHYMMDDLGIKRGETVQVGFIQNGKTIIKDIELKIENRDLATDYHDKKIANNRIQRPMNKHFPDSLLYLNTRLDGYEILEKDWLNKSEALHDLEYLEWEIKNHYSYAKLNGFDYETAFDIIKSDIGEGISKRDLALQLKMFLANFGDGHTRVSFRDILDKKPEYKWLPFKILKWEEKYYAINTQTKTYYFSEYPEIESINGKEIEEYYDLAEQLVAKSTTKFISKGTEDYMQITAFILKLAGQDISQDVSQDVIVSFAGSKGNNQESFSLDKHPKAKPRILYHHKDSIMNNSIGYIAFNEHMDSDSSFIANLHSSMQKVKNTKGLVVDIRQNGGGSRAPLLALMPYFIKQPVIANIARYRVNASENLQPKNGYLLRRYSYPLSYDEYTEAERQVIIGFAKDFKPSIKPADEEFSDYHYMVISPTTENETYYYDKPVIVLVDEGCFSASDIFAAGIQQGDNVRLLGNITGGGSGFSKRVNLPNSDIKVKLSRMFSYQPNGQMYDGQGVIPDIEVDYTFEDKLGKTDSQLERAIFELTKNR